MEGEGILPQKTHGDGLKAVLAIAVQGRTVDVVAEGPVIGMSLWSDIWKHQIPLASPPMASLGLPASCLDKTLHFRGHQKGDKSHKE